MKYNNLSRSFKIFISTILLIVMFNNYNHLYSEAINNNLILHKDNGFQLYIFKNWIILKKDNIDSYINNRKINQLIDSQLYPGLNKDYLKKFALYAIEKPSDENIIFYKNLNIQKNIANGIENINIKELQAAIKNSMADMGADITFSKIINNNNRNILYFEMNQNISAIKLKTMSYGIITKNTYWTLSFTMQSNEYENIKKDIDTIALSFTAN